MSESLPDYPVFVIALKGSVRARSLEDRLKALGLDYNLFDGVDGRNGLPAEFESQIDRVAARKSMGRRMTDAEFACALSHIMVYRQIIERGLPGAIILEDDAILGDDFLKLVNGGYYRKAPMMIFYHKKGRIFRGGSFDLFDQYTASRVSFNPDFTVAYSISRGAAEKYLSHVMPISHVADWGCQLRYIGAVVVNPLCVEHTGASIESSYLNESRSATERESNGPPKRSLWFKIGQLFSLSYWNYKWVKLLSVPNRMI